MNYDTTRRFSRSLAEAFPQDHADPIERYERTPLRYRAVNWASAFGVLFVILLIILENLK